MRISRGWVLMTSQTGILCTVCCFFTARTPGSPARRSRTYRPMATSTMRQQERDPPAPAVEVVLGGVALHQLDHAGGQQQAERHAQLRPAGEEAAPALRAPLHRQQHRAAPLAADADALQDPQDHQQDRGGDAPGRPAGQQAHQEGRDAHQHQRPHEGRLAADPVPVVAEDRGTDRPRPEADELHGERGQDPRVRRPTGEEDLGEDQRGHRAVQEKVIPLDRGADRAGDDGLPALGVDQQVRGRVSGPGISSSLPPTG